MLIALLIGLALVFAGLLVQYNGIVSLRQMVRNAWADVDVYLKRRAELIPNLVTAVGAYASHEKTVLEALATARSQALSAGGAGSNRAQAEQRVGVQLGQTLMLAESYPDLKSSDQFSKLQEELSDTERLIAAARQYYNACVRDYNTKREAFPGNLVAGLLNAKPEPFFEVETITERDAPSVGNS